MKNGKNQHVLPKKDKWAVRGEGNTRDTAVCDTKAEAMEKAKAIAKNQKSELIIHTKDGRISDKNSFGNDPHPPKDKK